MRRMDIESDGTTFGVYLATLRLARYHFHLASKFKHDNDNLQKEIEDPMEMLGTPWRS